MQKIKNIYFALLIIFLSCVVADAAVYVKGYFNSSGTYVAPHYRSNPDGNFWNNWSTYGNINPYTGVPGKKHKLPQPYSPSAYFALPGKITISPAITAPSYSQINSRPVKFLPYSRVGNDEYFEYPGFPKLKLRDSFAWNCSLLVQNGFDYEEYNCNDEKRRYINRLCNSVGDGVEMNIGENKEVSAIIFAHKCETYSESLERMVNGVRFFNGIYGPSTLNTVNHPSWLLSPEVEVALDNFLIDGCWVFLVGLKIAAP